MRIRSSLLISVFCVLFAPPLKAQTPRRLSLADALRMAQAYSAPGRGAQARIAGAEAKLRGAGTLANPTLLLSPHIGDNTGGLDEDILITQTIELGDKRRQRVYAAKAERDAALAQQVQARLDLAYSVQSAYYDALLAEVQRRQAADALAAAKTFAEAAQTQFQAGDVARSNVVRSKVEVARAAQALTAAETDQANRLDMLRSLTGLPEGAELMLEDTLTFTPKSYRLPDLQTLALKNRPDLLAARKLREARSADLHGARAASQPDLILEARHRTFSPTDEGSSLRFSIQFPLFDLGRNRADAKVAQTTVQEQEAMVQETLRTAQLEVRTALRVLEQARQTVESFQAGRLDSAKELLTMAQTGYSRGANSFLELLDAQQVYRSEQVEYVRALAAYNAAKATLQRAVGGTLP